MSLTIAASILDREKCSHSTKKLELYDNNIQDVITAVKEIQIQVEKTLNMSGAFVMNDLSSKDAHENLSPFQNNVEETSNVESTDLELPKESSSYSIVFSNDYDSHDKEKNFTLTSPIVENEQ